MESEIIRAMEPGVKRCTGCEAVQWRWPGKESRCAIKTMMSSGFWKRSRRIAVLSSVNRSIISGPMDIFRSLMSNASDDVQEFWILKKTRVGAIISVGGGEPSGPLVSLCNIFVEHMRKLSINEVNFVGRPGAVLARPEVPRSCQRTAKGCQGYEDAD